MAEDEQNVLDVSAVHEPDEPVEKKSKRSSDKPTAIAPTFSNISEIGNREVRQKHYAKLKREKKKVRHKREAECL